MRRNSTEIYLIVIKRNNLKILYIKLQRTPFLGLSVDKSGDGVLCVTKNSFAKYSKAIRFNYTYICILLSSSLIMLLPCKVKIAARKMTLTAMLMIEG